MRNTEQNANWHHNNTYNTCKGALFPVYMLNKSTLLIYMGFFSVYLLLKIVLVCSLHHMYLQSNQKQCLPLRATLAFVLFVFSSPGLYWQCDA